MSREATRHCHVFRTETRALARAIAIPHWQNPTFPCPIRIYSLWSSRHAFEVWQTCHEPVSGRLLVLLVFAALCVPQRLQQLVCSTYLIVVVRVQV